MLYGSGRMHYHDSLSFDIYGPDAALFDRSSIGDARLLHEVLERIGLYEVLLQGHEGTGYETDPGLEMLHWGLRR